MIEGIKLFKSIDTSAPGFARDDNADDSAEGHVDVRGDAPAADRAAVEHHAGGGAAALAAAELLVVGSDGPGDLAENDAGHEAVGAGPHPDFAAVMHPLRPIAAWQGAVSTRISNFEERQAHQQQLQLQQRQQQQHLHRQQQPQPSLPHTLPDYQSEGRALDRGQPLLGGIGAIGAQLYSLHESPNELAAVSAAVKAEAKALADPWWSREGQRFYMARECFYLPEEMSLILVSLLIQTVSGASDGVVRQLQFLSGFAVQDVQPPAPVEVSPTPMPVDIHLRIFIAAFLDVIEHGTKDAPVVCKYAVVELLKSLGGVERDLRAYLQFH